MNIGERIAQQGIIIRGKKVEGKFYELESIIKAKVKNNQRRIADEKRREPVAHKPLIIQAVKEPERATPSDKSLFADEISRLGEVVEYAKKNTPQLGTKHLRGMNTQRLKMAKKQLSSSHYRKDRCHEHQLAYSSKCEACADAVDRALQMDFHEAYANSEEPIIRKLGRIRSNFDNIEQRATNNSYRRVR